MELANSDPRVRESASVMLTRSWEGREVFLALRCLQRRSFPGTYVFPGGRVDPEDADLPVAARDPEVASEVYVAAARELFEETGVLVVAPRGESPLVLDPEALIRARSDLLEGRTSFREILEARGAVVDGGLLVPLGVKTTPPFHPRRFRNRFFLAVLPPGQEPEIWPGELVEGEWIDPVEAVASFESGGMLLSPPMLFLCEHWGKRSAREALPHLRRFSDGACRERPLRVRFSPEIVLFPGRSPTIPPATHTNTYLVGAERLLVVDPATDDPRDQERLLQLIDEFRAEGRQVEAVFLTHHHPDHHAATELVQEHCGAPLWGHPETAARLPHLHFDRLLTGGEVLDLGGGGNYRVLHTPGHAAGHLCLYQEKYRGLIVGDMLSTASSIVIDPHEDGDMAAYLASLESLLEVDARVLHPAHGDAFPDAPTLIRRFLEHRRQREEELLAALDTREKDLDTLVESLYQDTPRVAWPLAALSLEAGLVKLAHEGRARRGDGGWRSP